MLAVIFTDPKISIVHSGLSSSLRTERCGEKLFGFVVVGSEEFYVEDGNLKVRNPGRSAGAHVGAFRGSQTPGSWF